VREEGYAALFLQDKCGGEISRDRLYWLTPTEVVCYGLDEGGDGRFGGFDVGGMAEVAEGSAGDGADRGQEDFWGQGEVSGFEESEKVGGGGGTGEGDGVGVGRG